MKKAALFATGLSLAVLLAASHAIAAEEKKAAVKPAAGAEVVPLKAVEVAPVKTPAVELLDINSASAGQLQKVLGIGEDSAKKIIAGRPYVKKDQLKSRKIVTATHYYKIKDRIIARKPKVAAKAGSS